MKIRYLSLCLLAVFLMMASSVYSQNMNASGATTGVVNGIYVVAGTNDGVNYYQKGSIYLYRLNGVIWVIGIVLNSDQMANTYYYKASDAATPDGLVFNQNGDLGSGSGPTINETSLPVELASFTAIQEGDHVALSWITESEVENLGFMLERSEEGGGWTLIGSYMTHDALKGQGNTSSRTKYTFTDSNVEPATEYSYRLSDVSTTGEITTHAPLSVKMDNLPGTTFMENAYPNPFNPETYIAYHLAEPENVNISVFDLSGRRIRTLYSGQQLAGNYHVYWHGTDDTGVHIASGVYLIVMKTENARQMQKVMMVK